MTCNITNRVPFENNKLIINDFDTIRELSNFVRVKDSFKAEEGEQDPLAEAAFAAGDAPGVLQFLRRAVDLVVLAQRDRRDLVGDDLLDAAVGGRARSEPEEAGEVV